MSHLVAYVGNEPDNMACALFSARAALYVAARRDEPEGWGLGFVQGGDVLLQKRPRVETTEVDLYGLIKDLRADAVVGRVGPRARRQHARRGRRSVPVPLVAVRLDGRDRPTPAFESVRERLLESVPAFLRRNIRGKSPSEHVFHLFLAFLHDAGILDAPSPVADGSSTRRSATA